MKKKVLIWFCSIFALLVAFGLSHRFIISFGIESYLTSHLPKGEKISLSYQDLRFSDRMMVLQDVTLDRKGEAGFHIEVEHLTVAFDWGLSPLFFTPRVVIDHPHVALFDRAVKEKRQDKGLYQTLDKLLLRTPVEIHEGEISFGDEKILFSFVNELEEGGGSLRLQQVAEETPIEIQFRKKENQLQFDVSFHEVKIPWLFKIFQFYHPHFDANYLVSGGTLNGEGSLTLSSPRHIDHISYNFVLSEFLAEQKTYGLELSIDQLGWKEHFTSNEEMEGLVAHPFFDKIWPYFIGEGEIKGLHAALHDPKGEKTWIAADVNGSLRFSQTNEPLVELHGLFHQGEGEAPFHLLGNGIIEDTCFWKLAFDLHLLTEEELKLFFSFAAKGDHSYQMDVEYQNIGAPQIALLKHLIAPHFQPIEKVQVQEGTFQGKGSGWIEKKKLERIAISSFQVENLSCGMKDEQCVFHSLKIEGKGDFDLTSDDFFDGTEWELSVENGKLAFPNQETIKGIDLHLAMHDLYLKPSKLSCEVDGNQASFSFEGLYTHLNIQGDLLLDSKGLKHLVRGTCPLQLKEKRLPLHCALRLNTNGDRLGVDGMVSLVEEGNHSPILFGWNWPVEKLKQGEIFSGIELGWFGGENISAEAINLPLSLLGRDFYLEGTLCLEGTFNGRAIEMSIDPTHLVYHSEALSIVHGAGGQEKVPNCTFYYNFCQGIWRGKIPLKGARVNEHHFGIDFKTFTSEVSLEGTEFIFQNVDAIADGVHFQAEMAVDFSFDDRSELKIDTYSIEGEAEDILQFLKHFSLFQEVDLALKGKVFSGPGGMHLRAYVGEGEELLEWKIGLNLSEGQYPFSSSFGFDELAGEFYYCAEEKLFKIIEVEGTLHLTAGEKPKTYQLNVPVLHYDALEGVLNYDCRLEAPTYEICRVVGLGMSEGEEFVCHFDSDKTRFFGARPTIDCLAFGPNGGLSRADLSMTLSALDLVHHLDFLTSAGLLRMREDTLHEMRGPHVEGEMTVSLECNQKEERLGFYATSAHLKMGPMDLDDLVVKGERVGDHFILKQFKVGDLNIEVEMEREGNVWNIPTLEIIWKQSFLDGGGAQLDQAGSILSVPLRGLRIDLKEVSPLFSHLPIDWSYLPGTLFAKGELFFDFSKGLKKWGLDSSLKLIGENFGKGELRLESPELLHLSYHFDSGFSLSDADFNFLHPNVNELWGKCHFDRLIYHQGELSGKEGRLVVPPEMIHFLGKTSSLPGLTIDEERLVIFETPFKWDNQIDVSFDFTFGAQPTFRGRLKEGYYWISDKAWYLNESQFDYRLGKLKVSLNTLYETIPFDLEATLKFSPHFTSRLVIQESQEGFLVDDPLVIQTSWNQNEGFYIQSINGQVCGLDFSFHHNPKNSFLDQMALAGQLKVNVPKLSPLLPQSLKTVIQDYDIGNGYELSGDLILSKTLFEESHFTGYIKGKHFQLMGTVMETLLSEIDIRPDHIELDCFNISDVSGIFSMESLKISRDAGQQWEIRIPDLLITDFRPSLLKKVGKYPSPIKPLTIRHLRCSNIRGILGNKESFKGRGKLKFINTFKRDAHILDIPFEILGRLGLDMGLLVPVRGELEYILGDGKVYLTELKESYSEGKRSQFFLSPHQPSFIDLDGNLNVNIKMKQYVLLKVTEPFTLSIGGNFEKPKYSLR